MVTMHITTNQVHVQPFAKTINSSPYKMEMVETVFVFVVMIGQLFLNMDHQQMMQV